MKMILRKAHSPVSDNFFSDEFFNWPHGRKSTFNNMPPVNILDSANEFTVEMAVPGMKKEDFEITFEKDRLHVSSKARSENEDARQNYTHKEFNLKQGFERDFIVPGKIVDGDAIKANYENGVLRLSLPKKEEARPQPPKMIAVA